MLIVAVVSRGIFTANISHDVHSLLVCDVSLIILITPSLLVALMHVSRSPHHLSVVLS